ncbi:rCG32308 [Rattus norvegicus]|uniref:RCG32308 n=1 Tax=Rattus norvegicus TaxID=10116 RepID=A6JXN0_RAT|nr:rCG32308 [Rattus norvegicus]
MRRRRRGGGGCFWESRAQREWFPSEDTPRSKSLFVGRGGALTYPPQLPGECCSHSLLPPHLACLAGGDTF